MFRASALRHVGASVVRSSATPRFLRPAVQIQAFHASAPAREEEAKPPAAAEPSALMSYLGDARVAGPIGFLLAIPLIQNQVLILSEELQLLGCFMVFVGSVYSQAGDAIGKMLDEKGETVMAEHNAQEEVAISAVKSVIAAHEMKLSLVEEMKAVHATQAELLSMLADAKSMELQHMLRADIVKKLDYLVQKEEIARSKQTALLATTAAEAVTANFMQNKDLQAKALNQALDAIGDPSKAGDDVVATMFSDYFAAHTAAVKASTAEVEIPASVIEEAKAEILAMRKRDGNEDSSISLPTTASLASL